MAFKLATAFVEIFGKDDRLDKDLSEARAKLENQMGIVQGIASTVVASGIGAFAAMSISAAAAAQEMNSAFGYAFGELEAELDAWAGNWAARVNRGIGETKSGLLKFQATLKPLGFATKEAAELSKTLQKAAVDLASFHDQSDETAVQALANALTGEREMLKQLRIVINEQDVKDRMAAEGMENLTGEALKMAKAQATVALILERGADAMGDAERTAGSFTNQMKGLRAKVLDAQVAVGNVLLPVLTPLVAAMSKVVTLVLQFNSATGGFVAALAISAAGVIALTITIRALDTALGLAIKKFIIATAVAAGPFILLAGVLLTVVYGIKMIVNWLAKQEAVMESWRNLIRSLQVAWEMLKETAVTVINIVLGAVSGWLSMFGIDIPASINALQVSFASTVQKIIDWAADMVLNIVTTIKTMAENWQTVWNMIKLSAFIVVSSIVDRFTNIPNVVLAVFQGIANAIMNTGKIIGETFWTLITDPGSALQVFNQRVSEAFNQAMADAKNVADAYLAESDRTKGLKAEYAGEAKKFGEAWAKNRADAENRLRKKQLEDQKKDEEQATQEQKKPEEQKQPEAIKGFSALDQLSRKIQESFLKDEEKAAREKSVALAEKQTSIQEKMLEEQKKTNTALEGQTTPQVAGV